MGYDLQITRKEIWADEEDERFISVSEWKNYAENDPELAQDPDSLQGYTYLYLRKAGNWSSWYSL